MAAEKNSHGMRKIFVILVIAVLLAVGGFAFVENFISKATGKATKISIPKIAENVRVVSEESVVIDVVNKVSPSVVTVGIKKTLSRNVFEFDPFNPFGGSAGRTESRNIEQDIGSGFIVTSDGLIVTNKHVVSDTQAGYKVITYDDKTYDVEKIYRDPSNDLAIIKISASSLKPVEMGDSSKLQVGQMAIAIGTALGEFRQTVTKGVISGLGRGITAGSPFEGFVEQLDNVIQTDAAINPGNSGGPLLNSSGQVIGVNTAIAQGAQSIGFAIPINVVREAIDNFNNTGQFSRPFLGVRYRMVSRDLALLNEVPEGAYIIEVIDGSPAFKAGIEVGDILMKFGGAAIKEKDTDLAKLISQKKVGERVSVELWRDGEIKTVDVTLLEAE